MLSRKALNVLVIFIQGDNMENVITLLTKTLVGIDFLLILSIISTLCLFLLIFKVAELYVYDELDKCRY